MGADGDISAFAWYRATVDLKQAGTATLHFSGRADNSVVLVNGRRYDAKTPLAAGRNTIAVLASHRGRDNACGYMGTLDKFARKGLFGPVEVTIGGEKMDVTPWKLRGGAGPWEGNWQPVAATAGVPAFYRATFTAKSVPGRILRAASKGLSRGTMWLNGHNLGRYPEKIRAPGLYLPECWLKDGENTLVVFNEEGAAIAPVELEVGTAASREVIRVSHPAIRQRRWSFRLWRRLSRSIWPRRTRAIWRSASRRPHRQPRARTSPSWPTTAMRKRAGVATDGSLPQWWQVDLGAEHDLAGCEICWEADGRRYQYVVEGSADGRTWSVLCDRRQTQDREQVQKLQVQASRRAVRADHRDRHAGKPRNLGQHLRGQGLGKVRRRVGPDRVASAGPPIALKWWAGARKLAGPTLRTPDSSHAYSVQPSR